MKITTFCTKEIEKVTKKEKTVVMNNVQKVRILQEELIAVLLRVHSVDFTSFLIILFFLIICFSWEWEKERRRVSEEAEE